MKFLSLDLQLNRERKNFQRENYPRIDRDTFRNRVFSKLPHVLEVKEFSQTQKVFFFLERLISFSLESWQFCNFWREEARVIYWILCRRRHYRDFIISSRGKVCDIMITYICACFSTTVLGSWMLDYSITFPSYMQLKLYNTLCTCCNFQYEFLLVGVRKVWLKSVIAGEYVWYVWYVWGPEFC